MRDEAARELMIWEGPHKGQIACLAPCANGVRMRVQAKRVFSYTDGDAPPTRDSFQVQLYRRATMHRMDHLRCEVLVPDEMNDLALRESMYSDSSPLSDSVSLLLGEMSKSSGNGESA